MTTADKVKALIDEKGISQAQFAREIGIHPVTLCNMLKDDKVSPKTLEKIATTYGFDYQELLPSKEKGIPEISGYIEFNGQIQKVKKLEDLERIVEKLRKQIEFMKIKQVKLPPQKPIILDDIDLNKWETYDASKVEIKSFRHHYDIVNGREYSLGNMCSGYPFSLCGVDFNSSEAAYIAGVYSNDKPEHRRLQEKLVEIDDGYRAKKEYRHKRYDDIKRTDWETFNVEWMKYVVWQKCLGNKDFAKLLKSIPDSTMVIENSTGMTGATAQFWGCFNPLLEEVRDAKEEKFRLNNPRAKDEERNIERNKWHNFGVWEGTNEMGKIIKMCSICLKQGIELPIDYDLLRSKHIFLLGKELTFPMQEEPKVTLAKENKISSKMGVRKTGVVKCSDGYAYFYMGVPFSNWWTSPEMVYDGKIFRSSEAIYMYMKAMSCGDTDSANQIVAVDNDLETKEHDRFTKIKKLGRKAKGPNGETPHFKDCRKWMMEALKVKLNADPDFRDALLSEEYRGKTFVEASPYDDIWGIKAKATDELIKAGPTAWNGKNLLGEALTKLRDEVLKSPSL